MTKIEKKYVVQADSKISDVYSKLNTVQKQTISLFDSDRNGILDKNEAKAFNATVFSEKDDKIDCWLQLCGGKQTKISINKNEFDNTTLSLGWNTSKKQIVKDGKKVNLTHTQATLEKDNYSESLSEKFIENSRGYKLVSTDKNGNKKYAEKGTAPDMSGNGDIAYENYVILDVSGNIIEESQVDCVGESEYFAGRIVSKRGGKTEYYGVGNEKYGETQKDGNKTQYKDKNGQLLYSEVEHDDGHYTYYDENNKPLYEIKYMYDSPYVNVTYLDKNGKAIKEKDAFVPAQPFHNNYELFNKLEKDPIDEDGYFGLYKSTY